MTITATTNATATGTLTNSAIVTASTSDPLPANNAASAVSTTAPNADVAITKSATGTVIAGRTMTYTLVVINNGPSAATNPRVADTAPTGVSFTTAAVAADPGWICTVATGGGSVGCSAATLTLGATRTITISGTVSSTAPPGTITNSATISSDTPDTSTGNNSDSATTQITAQADVAVTLTGPSDPVVAGTTTTLGLQVRNNGPSVARNVVVTGQVPPGLIPVIGSSQGFCTYNAGTGTVTCVVGDLPAGRARR